MIFRKSIPEWVKKFPYELDREALITLAKNSKGRLESPREMNFVLYGFIEKQDIESAMDLIEKKGWSCSTQEQSDDQSKKLIISTKREYVLTEDQYVKDSSFFQGVAKIYNTGYDGWYASE